MGDLANMDLAAAERPALPDGVQEGQVIADKYRVERVIGHGAMGVLVAATHLDLGQRVALKLLSAQTLDDARIERFRREARAAAMIRSEHVARVMDVGVLPSGLPFIVMEHLDGADLSTALRQRGRFPISEAAERVIEACEALAEAHARGIVHRDLKPSNLFLARRADGSVALKVLDFGISKLPIADCVGGRLTAASALVGSPAYMSPEQIRRPAEVDARADVWSLGIILHELLTGSRPFDDSDERALLLRISTEEPRPVRELRPDASDELSAIVAQCLLKDVDRRIADVGELARRLAPFSGAGSGVLVERITRLLGQGAVVVDEPEQQAPSSAVATREESSPDLAREDPLLGTKLANRLSLVKRLGEGAMGVVYEAIDGDDGERVAVKLIRPEEASDPDARARLLREARAATRLRGEHAVRVLDAGPGGLGESPFIVMELLQGHDLEQEIRATGALDPGTVTRLFAQACAGLAEAHAQAMVHRDVKPANLFLHEGTEGRIIVKVCDFGIVKSTATEVMEPGAGGRTRTGFVLGSPAYMSPEQARNPSNVDPRSDVFSLCISMYEALSGKNPWAHCTTAGEFIVALWTEEIVSLGVAAPWVDPGLIAIVHRGLQRDPLRRFRDALALGSALQELAGGDVRVTRDMLVPAPRVTTAVPSTSTPGRAPRSWLRGGVVVAALGAIVVLGLMTRQGGRKPASEPQVELVAVQVTAAIPARPAPSTAEPASRVAATSSVNPPGAKAPLRITPESSPKRVPPRTVNSAAPVASAAPDAPSAGVEFQPTF